MRAQSAISTPTSSHSLPTNWSFWGQCILLFMLLVLARRTRAQSPDLEQAALHGIGTADSSAPRASFAYDGGSRCAGTVGQLAPALALGAAAGTFSAQPAGLSLDPTTGIINLAQSQAGAYTITHALAQPGEKVASLSTFLVLNALPSPTLTPTGPTSLAAGGTVPLKASGGLPGTTYQFFNNGQLVGSGPADTYTATTAGSYTVLAISPGSCVAASAPVAVAVAAAAPAGRATRAKVALTVYPNPAPRSFMVAITGSPSPVQLSIYDSRGQELQTTQLPVAEGRCTADLSHLAPGTYMLKATTTAGTITRRVERQ